tara:strand:- start:2308 stop:4311 length:2004 start_codon:yes stop_codon:yes gene_type:complete
MAYPEKESSMTNTVSCCDNTSHSCCDAVEEKSSSKHYSLLMSILGFLLQSHRVERLLFGQSPLIAFLCLSLLLGHFCYVSFKPVWDDLYNRLTMKQPKSEDPSQVQPPVTFQLPAMERIVLSVVILTWLVSLMAILSGAGEILLHDAILSAGVFSYTRSLRAQMANRQANYMADAVIDEVYSGNTRMSKKVSELLPDDRYEIVSTSQDQYVEAPVQLMLASGGVYIHDETTTVVNKPTLIQPGTPIVSGEVTVVQSYQRQSFRHHELDDWHVKMFLIGFYFISFVMACAMAYTSGILAASVSLAECLMLVCPCVYVSIKARFHQALVNKASQSKWPITVNKFSLLRSRVVVVFDRTRTLAFPHSRGDDYQISQDKIDMIAELKSKGFLIAVVSAHNGSNGPGQSGNEALTKSRREDMARLLDLPLHQLVFNCSQKEKQIQMLRQNQSSLILPGGRQPTWLDRLRGFINPNTVVMVGNDEQDKAAMQVSDCGIMIGDGSGVSDAFDIKIARPVDLNFLPEFLSHQRRYSGGVRHLSRLVMSISVVSLMLVLGLPIGGIAIAPCLVCAFSSVICLIASVPSLNAKIAKSHPAGCANHLPAHQLSNPSHSNQGQALPGRCFANSGSGGNSSRRCCEEFTPINFASSSNKQKKLCCHRRKPLGSSDNHQSK